MTQVSKYPLEKNVQDRIDMLFLETISNIKDKNKLKKFLDGFLSPTERIMLSKRLAIVLLLAKEHDYQSIRGLLHVTPTTISKMSLKIKYAGEGIKPVIEDVYQRQATRIIWEEFKDLLDLPKKGQNLKERAKRRYKRGRKINQIKREF